MFLKRLSRVGLCLAMVFMSLSSAPLISSGLQLMMITWDRLFAFLRARWFLLILLGLTTLGTLQLTLPGGLLTFIFDHFLLMPQTGYGRLEQLYWGSLSVMNHPFFGASDWVRPYYLGFGSIDNFWLVTAVRSGLPSLLLLWFAIAANVLGILTATDLDPVAQRYRRGYTIALTGLLMVLASVSIWGPVSTFVLTYIGAGPGSTCATPCRPWLDRRRARDDPPRAGPCPRASRWRRGVLPPDSRGRAQAGAGRSASRYRPPRRPPD